MERVPVQDPSFLSPGAQVGPWRVVSLCARGRSSGVFRVEHLEQKDGEPFALKLALHAMDGRFEHEVELLSRVRDGHVPRLKDSGLWRADSGAVFPYLVTEWIQGEPLYAWAERHKLTSRQAMSVVAQISRALAAVHAAEGVHRDVTGAHVRVEKGGRAVLMGFGSSTYRGARPLTPQLEMPGTPPYWSPEALHYLWRIRSRATTSYEARPADDVYALGVLSYRLVTGSYPPGWAPQGDGVLRAGRIAPERLVTVSPALATLIRRMLSQDPEARGRAEEVAEALEHAARKAGRRADQPIVRRGTWASRLEALRSGLSRPEVAWLGWLAAAVLGAVLALMPWRAQHDEKRAEPPAVVSDEGTTALGNEALMTKVEAEKASKRPAALGQEMPKKPLPGQRQPPCGKNQVAIYGGCWIFFASKGASPCQDDLYAWKDACYAPAIILGRPSTSADP
jgi:Protein kinase domain